MRDARPTRAYFPGQDFSSGANAPGQLSVLDLSVTPPAFRATGSLGFSGNIAFNFSPKIAVAEGAGIAYALGNSTTNQFVRAIDISADPTGVVVWPLLGDIPIARDIPTTVGIRDMEVLANGALLFVTSGSQSSGVPVVLDVFDTTSVPSTMPAAPIQSISFASAGFGPAVLELSPDESKLALALGADNHPQIRIYDVVPGAPQPLVSSVSFPLANMSGSDFPGDVHWSPDGTLLFVSGGNGFFAVIDMTVTPPSISLNGLSWGAAQTSSYSGSAVAISGGTQYAVLGEPSTTGGAMYRVVDLNPTVPSYGSVVNSFTTNATGNISSHRGQARQGIAIFIDGTGATVDCQMVDVIDLDQPVGTGYQTWRVKMPTFTNLTPGGLSSIPRDFDLY